MYFTFWLSTWNRTRDRFECLTPRPSPECGWTFFSRSTELPPRSHLFPPQAAINKRQSKSPSFLTMWQLRNMFATRILWNAFVSFIKTLNECNKFTLTNTQQQIIFAWLIQVASGAAFKSQTVQSQLWCMWWHLTPIWSDRHAAAPETGCITLIVNNRERTHPGWHIVTTCHYVTSPLKHTPDRQREKSPVFLSLTCLFSHLADTFYFTNHMSIITPPPAPSNYSINL